jgi:hypothetical protein
MLWNEIRFAHKCYEIDDPIRFVAANANNKEPTVRAKVTDTYETDIDQENNVQPFNEMNDDLQETHQEVPLHELLIKSSRDY